MSKTINRRQRLFEFVEKQISEGNVNVVGRKIVPIPELIRLCIDAANRLPTKRKTGSKKADYLAELLAIPMLSNDKMGIVSQNALSGQKSTKTRKEILGVRHCLKQLEKLDVNTSILVRIFLEEKPEFSYATINRLKILRGLPENFKKNEREIARNIGVILFWKQKRKNGLIAQQIFLEGIGKKRQKIYGTREQQTLGKRTDLVELYKQGVPIEELRHTILEQLSEKKPKKFKPKSRKFKTKIRRQHLL